MKNISSPVWAKNGRQWKNLICIVVRDDATIPSACTRCHATCLTMPSSYTSLEPMYIPSQIELPPYIGHFNCHR